MQVPVRYVPRTLRRSDRAKQIRMLKKSRSAYKKGRYYTRKALPSFKSKPSGHVANARRIYGVDKIRPDSELSKATGCSTSALKQIMRKGEGAYYSSGSRPNQTAQSWGVARLASAISGGKASAVDFKIIEKGCSHTKKAFKLAKKSSKYGRAKTMRTSI